MCTERHLAGRASDRGALIALVGAALLLGCGRVSPLPPASSVVQQAHSELTSARASPAAAGVALAVPLTPCERVDEHNLRLLREASARVDVIIGGMSGNPLKTRVDAAEQQLKAAGAVTTRTGARLDSLDDRQLDTLAMLNYEAREYATARERVATLTALEQALSAKQPLPVNSMASFEVELCKPDAHGAWAFWTVDVAYQPEDDSWSKWSLSRKVALARVSANGELTLAQRFPSFLHGSSSDKDFPGLRDDNCCSEGYGIGEPQLLFVNDQNSDGVPEIGLRASYGVEGTHEVSAVLYRFEHGSIREEEWPVESMTDVDGDGRLDIVAVDEVPAADQCGSGFPSYSASLPYLGHALPDGTYSFDDATARAHLLQQCPTRPKSFGDAQAIWCAKAWGVTEKALSLGAARLCAKDPCQGQSNLRACESLESAIGGLKPPLTLQAPGARH